MSDSSRKWIWSIDEPYEKATAVNSFTAPMAICERLEAIYQELVELRSTLQGDSSAHVSSSEEDR